LALNILVAPSAFGVSVHHHILMNRLSELKAGAHGWRFRAHAATLLIIAATVALGACALLLA